MLLCYMKHISAKGSQCDNYNDHQSGNLHANIGNPDELHLRVTVLFVADVLGPGKIFGDVVCIDTAAHAHHLVRKASQRSAYALAFSDLNGIRLVEEITPRPAKVPRMLDSGYFVNVGVKCSGVGSF